MLVASKSLEQSAVYVSLAPGSAPSGLEARILDRATAQSITVSIVRGGFDPVAIPASIGDTLAVEISGIAGETTHALSVIAPRRPPTIVRTDPPPRKRDVALNPIIVIVFSEPIDASTLGPESMILRQGGTTVPGTIHFEDVAHVKVTFIPETLLDASTDYELVLSQNIRTVNGVALGSPVTIPFTTGIVAPNLTLAFSSLSAGATHTCGVTNAGAAYCWGDNTDGALGDGTTVTSLTPVRVAGALTFATVSAGYFHTCGVTTDHELYCWGGGWLQHFGSVPVRVSAGRAYASVSVGQFNACGVTTAGRALCWGQAGFGELGNGSQGGSTTPVEVAGGLTFASVSAGVYTTCGLTTAGAAYCWGINTNGGLGTGTAIGPECLGLVFYGCSSIPVAVIGGHTFKQVEAKVYAACGLTTDDIVYCWGSNLNDALGLGTITGPQQCAWDGTYVVACVLVPTVVPGSPAFVSLTTSEQYACGLMSSGAAYCWGHPQNTGDLLSNTAPVAVPGGLTFASISAGQTTTCGVTPAGVAYCWGSNDLGQLGDGTTNYTTVPVRVRDNDVGLTARHRVEVTAVTTGVNIDPDGYAVVDQDPWDYADTGVQLPPNGGTTLFLTLGGHVLKLVGVAANCSGDGLDGRAVTVNPGVAVTRVEFQVVCK